MKVLIVARYKQRGYAPFVTEQVEALIKAGVACEFFPMHSKGIRGYLREFPRFRRRIQEYKPDVIHAHYGLCGVFANLQRRIPVVTTYHGSDINDASVLWLSRIAMRLSAYNIFVSHKSIDLAKPKKDFALIPCGINLDDYPPIDKLEARKQMELEPGKKYVLFAGAFDNAVKNAPLAKEVVALLHDVELLELKGYSRSQVAVLMQAVDAFLMTSHSEGSPQVIKEAMACGCPIVSVDVGDVRERIDGVDGCWISERVKNYIADALQKALSFPGRTKGRDVIIASGLTNTAVADKLIAIYDRTK